MLDTLENILACDCCGDEEFSNVNFLLSPGEIPSTLQLRVERPSEEPPSGRLDQALWEPQEWS